ncbi:MAG: hypothetical protein JWQ76_4870 [Ramlibacter sp.]|nr:hypothetical protein [Ramlibacter sp.]
MPNDTDTNLSLSWARAGAAEAAAQDAFDTLLWWLTGGVSLLIWTGLALLLTNA